MIPPETASHPALVIGGFKWVPAVVIVRAVIVAAKLFISRAVFHSDRNGMPPLGGENLQIADFRCRPTLGGPVYLMTYSPSRTKGVHSRNHLFSSPAPI